MPSALLNSMTFLGTPAAPPQFVMMLLVSLNLLGALS